MVTDMGDEQFDLLATVREIEELIQKAQENVPAFPMVFGYLPPACEDPCYLMSGTESQQIALCEKMKAVPVGNFLDRLAKERAAQQQGRTGNEDCSVYWSNSHGHHR